MAEGVDYDLIHRATLEGRIDILCDFTYPEIDNTLSNLYDTASLLASIDKYGVPISQ